MSAIEDLERKAASLRDKLRDAEAKLRNARLAASPVKVGDIVRTIRDGKLYRVTNVDFRPWGIRLKGNPQRKDGTFGKAERHIYGDWEAGS